MNNKSTHKVRSDRHNVRKESAGGENAPVWKALVKDDRITSNTNAKTSIALKNVEKSVSILELQDEDIEYIPDK